MGSSCFEKNWEPTGADCAPLSLPLCHNCRHSDADEYAKIASQRVGQKVALTA